MLQIVITHKTEHIFFFFLILVDNIFNLAEKPWKLLDKIMQKLCSLISLMLFVFKGELLFVFYKKKKNV